MNIHYNNDSNLANSTFTYLNKLGKPVNSKESHTNLTEIFHNLRILINLGLHDRITRLTLDTLIMKGFTNGGMFKSRAYYHRQWLLHRFMGEA